MRRKRYIVKLFISFIVILNMISIMVLGTNTGIELELSSPSALVMDADTGKILYEKNANEKRYPASTTKMMTAILTLENCNLEDITTVSSNAILSVPSGYTSTLLQVGEELTIKDLLYALLVKSCNEAANVLAEHVAGSVESFASMMNTKAAELGCQNTHFVNPNGVQNENHYSSAYDLALIAQYGMKNEEFRKIVKTVSYTLPTTNKYGKKDRTFTTTNDLIRSNTKNYYPYAIGIKTGYTKEAGNCLVAGSQKDGMKLISVVLGAEKNLTGVSKRDIDTKALFNAVYEQYELKTIIKKEDVIHTIEVRNAKKENRKLDLLAKEELKVTVSKQGNEHIEQKVNLKDHIKAPIAKGDILGTISYQIDDIEYQMDLVASHDVEEINVGILIIIGSIVLVIFILVYGTLVRMKKNKKRKKRKHGKYAGTY